MPGQRRANKTEIKTGNIRDEKNKKENKQETEKFLCICISVEQISTSMERYSLVKVKLK